MAEDLANHISIKVYVEKGKNRVIYAECDEDLVDIIFSFLTSPMGIIAILARNQSLTKGIDCLLNLYTSIENTDVQQFHSKACKSVLLTPRYAASYLYKDLKLKVYNGLVMSNNYFRCSINNCGEKKLSYYPEVYCECGNPMIHELKLRESAANKEAGSSSCFLKRKARFIISDDLQVMPFSSSLIFSWFSRLGIKDSSIIQEKIFNIGAYEVLNLLICSLFSKTPLTETFCKYKPAVPEKISTTTSSFHDQNHDDHASIKEEKIMKMDDDHQVGLGITVKLIISKSKNMVCYAEADKEFVSLLFSFLTVPLGHLAKQVDDDHDYLSFKGCIGNLYKCVKNLDPQFYQSDMLKKLLVCPLPAFGCSVYTIDLLGIEEPWLRPYYFEFPLDKLCAQIFPSHYQKGLPSLSVINPLSDSVDGGYMTGPTRFMVTDKLVITPISSTACFSTLEELNVSFSDIEERVVRVGKDEAVQLSMSLLVSESALTNAFIRSQRRSNE